MTTDLPVLPITLKVLDYNHELTIHIQRPLLLGRGDADAEGNFVPDVDLNLFYADDEGVSRRHLLLIPDRNAVLVQDLNSTNGSFLSEQPLEPQIPYVVRSGDQLRLGRLRLQVCYEINLHAANFNQAYDPPTLRQKMGSGATTPIESSREVSREQRSTLEMPRPNSAANSARLYGAIKFGGELWKAGAERPTTTDAPSLETLSPAAQKAYHILRQIVLNKDISEAMMQYIAKHSTEHTNWRQNRRLAVLETACEFGYVSRQNPELLAEQRRLNKLRYGGVDE